VGGVIPISVSRVCKTAGANVRFSTSGSPRDGSSEARREIAAPRTSDDLLSWPARHPPTRCSLLRRRSSLPLTLTANRRRPGLQSRSTWAYAMRFDCPLFSGAVVVWVHVRGDLDPSWLATACRDGRSTGTRSRHPCLATMVSVTQRANASHASASAIPYHRNASEPQTQPTVTSSELLLDVLPRSCSSDNGVEQPGGKWAPSTLVIPQMHAAV
jgi:hypothetical protein